jgi:hypothetical protein
MGEFEPRELVSRFIEGFTQIVTRKPLRFFALIFAGFTLSGIVQIISGGYPDIAMLKAAASLSWWYYSASTLAIGLILYERLGSRVSESRREVIDNIEILLDRTNAKVSERRETYQRLLDRYINHVGANLSDDRAEGFGTKAATSSDATAASAGQTRARAGKSPPQVN